MARQAPRGRCALPAGELGPSHASGICALPACAGRPELAMRLRPGFVPVPSSSESGRAITAATACVSRWRGCCEWFRRGHDHPGSATALSQPRAASPPLPRYRDHSQPPGPRLLRGLGARFSRAQSPCPLEALPPAASPAALALAARVRDVTFFPKRLVIPKHKLPSVKRRGR